MRFPAFLSVSVILLISCPGCGSDEGVGTFLPPGDDPVYDLVIDDLDDEFDIGLGERVYIESEGLDILFEDVCDSRCPVGVICFWEGEGIVDLRLTVSGGVSSVARPVTRPGYDPARNTWLKDYVLGYSVTLLSLIPYPSISEPQVPEDYRATLLFEKVPDESEHGHVVFTFIDPCTFLSDRLEIVSAGIEGDLLRIGVRYSGGCEDHIYRLYARPVFMESFPVRMDLYLHHEDNDDPCDAILAEELSFNLSRIGELYKAFYDDDEGVILGVAVCHDGVRGEEVSVQYRP